MAYHTIEKGKKILHRKYLDEDLGIIEMKIFEVPKTYKYPLGLRYSLYYVWNAEVIVGYDNHYPKGPHKHFLDEEHAYNFQNLDQLITDFDNDIEKAKQRIKAS